MNNSDLYLYEAFEGYFREHTPVYDLFETYAWDVIRTGRTKFGAKAIIERIRWYEDIEQHTKGKEEFKQPDQYTAYFARCWRVRYPEHAQLFEYRLLRECPIPPMRLVHRLYRLLKSERYVLLPIDTVVEQLKDACIGEIENSR